jgi:hypothetical protein
MTDKADEEDEDDDDILCFFAVSLLSQFRLESSDSFARQQLSQLLDILGLFGAVGARDAVVGEQVLDVLDLEFVNILASQVLELGLLDGATLGNAANVKVALRQPFAQLLARQIVGHRL